MVDLLALQFCVARHLVYTLMADPLGGDVPRPLVHHVCTGAKFLHSACMMVVIGPSHLCVVILIIQFYGTLC